MAHITLNRITKRFGPSIAVEDLSLEVERGGFLAVLGPSGCGKSTVLRLIAGFDRVTDGQVLIDGKLVSSVSHQVPAEKRHIGFVFQSYALWPHMTVEGNVGYALRIARIRGQQYAQRVRDALHLVGLDGYGGRRPSELSGGQRQRVALARCMVMEPSLVLLDEPLANLDVHLRASMEDEFRAFHQRTGATMVYVTHDQAEAMALSQQIVVMDKGRLVQVADPRELYRQPRTAMVAGFIGKSAIVDAQIITAASAGCCRARLFGVDVELRCRDDQLPGSAKVCLRPGDIALGSSGVPAVVKRSTYKGGTTDIEVVPDAAPAVMLLMSVTVAPPLGARVIVTINDGWVIPT